MSASGTRQLPAAASGAPPSKPFSPIQEKYSPPGYPASNRLELEQLRIPHALKHAITLHPLTPRDIVGTLSSLPPPRFKLKKFIETRLMPQLVKPGWNKTNCRGWMPPHEVRSQLFPVHALGASPRKPVLRESSPENRNPHKECPLGDEHRGGRNSSQASQPPKAIRRRADALHSMSFRWRRKVNLRSIVSCQGYQPAENSIAQRRPAEDVRPRGLKPSVL